MVDQGQNEVKDRRSLAARNICGLKTTPSVVHRPDLPFKEEKENARSRHLAAFGPADIMGNTFAYTASTFAVTTVAINDIMRAVGFTGEAGGNALYIHYMHFRQFW